MVPLSERTLTIRHGCRTLAGILLWVASSPLLGAFYLFYFPHVFNNFNFSS
jgi:hypothetical protein